MTLLGGPNTVTISGKHCIGLGSTYLVIYLSPFAVVEHDADGHIQLTDVVAVAAVVLGAEHPVPQEYHKGAALSLGK